MVSFPPGVMLKTVPRALAPPELVVPYNFPSRPWTRGADGALPLLRLKLTRLVNDCAGKAIAVAIQNSNRPYAFSHPLSRPCRVLLRRRRPQVFSFVINMSSGPLFRVPK